MKCEAPAFALRSSREPAPIQNPIATERTPLTRSVTTRLSNVVGQRVMHDLRSAVYRHLQRLSLAFFTRTRTGEIQSRIANDIGGIQNVVTSTATSIVSNVATVGAAVIAMFLLSWQL